MAREIAVLVNPTAGRGRAARAATAAVTRLEEAGSTVRLLQGVDAVEAGALAREAVAGGVETLVAVGGDGLVNVAANVVAHTDAVLGIVPAGTGNDAARCLGIPRSDPRAAADVIVGGRVRTVDLGRAGPSSFVCVLSAGFDAAVTARAGSLRRPRGRARYALATVAELRTLRPESYELHLDGARHLVEAVLVSVANAPSFGGGLRIAPDALLDDGLLDVVLVHPLDRLDLVRTFPRLYRGSHRGHPAYEHHRVREVTVAGPGVVTYADGERVGPLPVTVRVDSGALRVLTPPDRSDPRPPPCW